MLDLNVLAASAVASPDMSVVLSLLKKFISPFESCRMVVQPDRTPLGLLKHAILSVGKVLHHLFGIV